MLNKFFLFLFFVHVFLVYVFRAEANDYVDYFRIINQAELYIAKSNYQTALSIYKDVFKRFPHNFEKEMYNACLCAIKVNQWRDALHFSRKLVLHGYELKDFESQAFYKLRNNKKYWKQFLSEYLELRQQYEKKNQFELQEKYLALYKIDQQFANYSVGIKIQDSVFYEHILSVSKLIKKFGFPQWMINKDTINEKLQVMLRHYCGLENRIKSDEEMQKDSFYIRMQGSNIRLLVTKALHEGWVDPERYVSIVSEWDGINPYGEIVIGIDYEKEEVSSFLQIPLEKRNEMNRKRDSIGLPIIEESLQIKPVWYKEYPFKKIKEAWLACDTCSDIDYIRIAGNIALEVRNQYEDKENIFRYYSKNLSNNVYYFNIVKYQKYRKKKHDTDI